MGIDDEELRKLLRAEIERRRTAGAKADASVVSSGANPDVTPVAHRHAI
jgi:hypothetical protein